MGWCPCLARGVIQILRGVAPKNARCRPKTNIQTMSKEPPVMGPNTGPICRPRQILKRKIAASRQTLFSQNNHVTIATVYITMMTIIHRKFFPSHEI